MVSKWVIYNLLINGVYWSYNPLILTSWDIQADYDDDDDGDTVIYSIVVGTCCTRNAGNISSQELLSFIHKYQVKGVASLDT